MCLLLSFRCLISHVTLPKPQLTSMFFISQRDLGRDQASPCRAWRSVPVQPREGQHQPNPAGRASPAQVNKHSTIDQKIPEALQCGLLLHGLIQQWLFSLFSTSCLIPTEIMPKPTFQNPSKVVRALPRFSCIVCHSVRFGGKSAVLLCSTEGECVLADGGDRWWIKWKPI